MKEQRLSKSKVIVSGIRCEHFKVLNGNISSEMKKRIFALFHDDEISKFLHFLLKKSSRYFELDEIDHFDYGSLRIKINGKLRRNNINARLLFTRKKQGGNGIPQNYADDKLKFFLII